MMTAAADATLAEQHRRRERSVLYRRERDLRALTILYRMAVDGAPPAELLDQVCELVLCILGTDAVWVHLHTDDDPPYRLAAASGLGGPALNDLRWLRIGVGVSGQALVAPTALAATEGENAVAAAPIPTLGVLSTSVGDPRRRYTTEELSTLETLAVHAGLALETSRGLRR